SQPPPHPHTYPLSLHDALPISTLANLLTQIKYRGSVASCGLAGGNDLPTTVIPFIIRGVNLLGIDSVMAPLPLRVEAWRRLASRSEEHTSELQSLAYLVCRLLL